MNRALLLLALLDQSFIALLPAIFFRRDGSLNARWFATAVPFMLCIAVIALALFGVVEPWRPEQRAWEQAMRATAVVLCASSIGLIALTIGTHRIPIALWHQQDDAPKHIVTWGAYRYVRHPFYAAFLLCLIGTILALPHPLTVLAFLYSVVALNLTAAREEKRLAASEFGSEYREYMVRTGRFWPRLSPGASKGTA